MSTAQVIPFKKPSQSKQGAGGNMYSDRFVQGHVMSSRLYRKEVWPFISDAARNVYAELENRINGHLKETDYVSYSQLQGSDLPGARQLGRKTVSAGLKELIKYGIISIVGSGKQGMKSYCLNEVSIKDRFTKGTSSPSTPVPPVNQSSSPSTPATSSLGEHTIDTSLDSLENKKKNLPVDNSETEMFGDSVKYHSDNSNLYTLRELASQYPVQSDLQTQAKNLNSELSDEIILAELKGFAQWSTGKSKTTAQNWMNFWIYRIQNLKIPKAKSQKPNKPKSKGLSDLQINLFTSELCNYEPFASNFSNPGEPQKSFEARIKANLRNLEHIKKYGRYLHELGFVVDLEDFA
ncbi:hypothetical protein D3C80_907190 [compost metagenome]